MTLKSKEVQDSEAEAYARRMKTDGTPRVKVTVNGQQGINIVTKQYRFERFLPFGPCHLPFLIQFLEDALMFKAEWMQRNHSWRISRLHYGLAITELDWCLTWKCVDMKKVILYPVTFVFDWK